MRSPNAFVVAVRKPDGSIRLRKDQWFGVSKKFPIFQKPFFRGVVALFEAMANGIVSLNYSANIAMEEEKPKSEKVDLQTFLTMGFSFLCGLALFVFAPHAITETLNRYFELNWALDGFYFHFVDGLVKGTIFVLYIWGIGFIPDIKRVFQYHGAEHKTISTFEAGEDLIVENASRHSTLHPRCGTSFIFFLLFISIVIFSALFTFIPLDEAMNPIQKHLLAIVIKIGFMFPVAGVSYEIIKMAGKYPKNPVSKILSYPGMALQKLTTREPDQSQLEVALCSMKSALELEEKYNLKEASSKVAELQEVDISSIDEIENANTGLRDFLEC